MTVVVAVGTDGVVCVDVGEGIDTGEGEGVCQSPKNIPNPLP